MSQNQITHRYAQALFDLAEGENGLYPVYVSFQEISVLLKQSPDFKTFVYNPLLSIDERATILRNVFENKIPKLLFKFLMFLNAKNRFNLIAGIFESLDELFLEKNNQMRVDLQTAFNLQDDQKKNIQNELSHKYHKEITLNTQVKPDLLGGFRLLAAGTLFDGTIKNQLEQFRQKVSV